MVKVRSHLDTVNINGVSIKAFVLESNLNLEPQVINLYIVWPSLDKKMRKRD